MQHPYFEHPAEEVLERFLLHHSPEDELEMVETHMLACEACVKRLELLELQISALKLAIQEVDSAPEQRLVVKRKPWYSAFFLPALSWAGAAAGIALCVAMLRPADVTLSANRGAETALVPEWRNIHFHLNAPDLNDGPVGVQVVNIEGRQVWKGEGKVSHEQANVSIPRIQHRGNYLLRLYSPGKTGPDGELLREFSFSIK